jgi:hypothetical protein
MVVAIALAFSWDPGCIRATVLTLVKAFAIAKSYFDSNPQRSLVVKSSSSL